MERTDDREHDRAAGHTSPDDGRVDLGELFAILAARRRGIAFVTCAVAGAALAYVYTATPLYTGETAVLYDPRQRGVLAREQQAATPTTDAAEVDSQVKIIASDAVLGRVVAAERLADDPEFGEGAPGLRGLVLGAIGLGRGMTTAGAEERTAAALRALSGNVTVKRSERTYVIEIEVTSRDPRTAARLANAVARAYAADQQDAKAASARREGDWLDGRLDELQARVREAERAVEDYKLANRIVLANGKPINDQDIETAAETLATARTRTAETKAKLDQIQRLIRAGQAPDALPDPIRSGVIERLRQQFAEITRQEASLRRTLGPRHPSYLEVQQQLTETRRLIAEELRRIASATANELQIAREAETAAERQAEQIRLAASSTGQTSIRLRELERGVEASRAVYDRFLRAREAIGQDAADSAQVRVIAVATTPQYPSSPRKTPIMALALAIGLGLGVSRALLLDHLARSARPRGDTKQPAPPAIIATLPPMPGEGLLTRLRRLSPLPETAASAALLRPNTRYARAVTEVLDKLKETGAAGGRRTLLVAGGGTGEAKTALALNMAWLTAARGLRTLVVDADVRRQQLSRMVGAAGTAGTLLLDGGRVAARCIGPDWIRGPVVVSTAEGTDAAGEPDADGAAFEVVILDGPDVGDLAALAALARQADDVLVVAAGAAEARQIADMAARGDIPADRLRGIVTATDPSERRAEAA